MSMVPPGSYSAVVRFLARDEKRNEFHHLGSGTIIGRVGDQWAVVASASHVFEDVDELLGLGPPHLPGFPRDDSPNRRYSSEALRHIVCGVTLHGGNGAEVLCPLVAAETSKVISRRDTALAFVALPGELQVAGRLGRLPINLGPPPWHHEAILVAGFGKRDAAVTATRADGSNPMAVPPRDLIVREGFYADFGAMTGRLHYHLVRHLIPCDPGMSGGPVMLVRPDATGAQWSMMAINNVSMDQPLPLQEHVEGESFATHVLALYSHEVLLLPTTEWVPFAEAVKRDIIFSVGSEARGVVELRNDAGAVYQYRV
jgi:hypothetical protein